LSRLARRGRAVFLFIATLIVLDRLSSIVLALAGDPAELRLWRSVCIPALMILGVLSLWQGETWPRRLFALWCLLHGGLILAPLGFVLFRMAEITPPEKSDVFQGVTVFLLGLPLLYAAFYMLAGAVLWLSPSVRAFSAHQFAVGANPFTDFADWIMGYIKGDRRSRKSRRFFREFHNRRRYPVLTRDTLALLDGSHLIDAVVDYVTLKIGDDHANSLKTVSSLPRGFQAVYSTWWVRAEVNNGGFHQYFYNKGVDWAFMALEGYKLFGQLDLAGLMARAIEVYLQEEPGQLAHHTDDPTQLLAEYVQAREISTLPELDSLFYKADDQAPVERYIRAHRAEFIAK
jgi:hypothetical protein